MRIAIDIRSLTDERMTGVGFYTKCLVEAMAQASPQDEFILFASGSTATLARVPTFKPANIEVVKVTIPNRLLFLLLKLPGGPTLESFLTEPPDVWIFPKFNLHKTHLPYFQTIHDLAFALFPEFITWKERLHNRLANVRKSTEKAQGLLAVSDSTALDLQTCWKIEPSRIQVTPLGVDHDVFVAREQASDKTFRAAYDLNRPYILALATREPRKNLETVIEAYTLFREHGHSRLPLVFSGAAGWKTRALQKLLAANPYAADILVLGYVPEKHKPAIYRGAAALLFPSFYEGFGLPVLEAMACGTPVITSATSALPEVLGHTGILVDPFNVNDIVAALNELFNRPQSALLRQQLATKATARAQQFSWDLTAQRTLAALATLRESK